MRIRLALVFFPALFVAFHGASLAQEPKSVANQAITEGVLKAADVGAKLFPDKVYFRGQVGTGGRHRRENGWFSFFMASILAYVIR